MPKEFENQDFPGFALRLNVPCLPGEKKSAQDNKAFDHICEQGKSAFHLKVAKSDTQFFTFLANHAHRMKLDTKYCGKFAKLTATLGNIAPLSNCTRLQRCIQGHPNFHLSSTSITINGIDDLDASKVLRNMVNGSKIAHISLCDMLYCIQLANTLALRGLEELFLQVCCCVSFLFWREIGFGFIYYLCT